MIEDTLDGSGVVDLLFGHAPSPRSTNECSIRARQNMPWSTARLLRPRLLTVYQCTMQRGSALESCCTFRYVCLMQITASRSSSFFTALPHMATNDDVYRGYFIPSGTIVIGTYVMFYEQIVCLVFVECREYMVSLPSMQGKYCCMDYRRAILHDEDTYPDPLAFKPERFLSYEEHQPDLDPCIAAFGFGRRCAACRIAPSLLHYNFH